MENENRLDEVLLSRIDGMTAEQIANQVSTAKRIMSYYKCALLEVETKFRVLNEHFSLTSERNPIESIKTRIKSFKSIKEKMDRRGIPLTLTDMERELHDIAGIRVICSYIDDIYLLSDYLIKQDDVRLIEKKDYISNPKPNGYRSLHLIIEIPIFLHDEKRFCKVEVQLRTISMENWANLEHRMRYKKKLSDRTLQFMDDELYRCAELSYRLDEKMRELRILSELDKETEQ